MVMVKLNRFVCWLSNRKNKNKENSLKKYIGVKVVEANHMNLGDYNAYRGWTIPADMLGEDWCVVSWSTSKNVTK